MADLEEHAFKRDRRFIVRLVLMLSVSALFGLFVYDHLTSRHLAGCAADAALRGRTAEPGEPAKPIK
jgi:hypothetical protein